MGLTQWELLEEDLLSDDWAQLHRAKLRLTLSNGTVLEQYRQTYDRGDGTVLLPYDLDAGRVLLGRQFRWPAARRGDADPHLIEAAAGALDDAVPEDRIRAEVSEELGLTLGPVEKVFEAYSSPGSITEIMHYFVAPYTSRPDQSHIGGLEEEGEEIEVIDLTIAEALAMIRDGRIRDAKTIILLQYAALHIFPRSHT